MQMICNNFVMSWLCAYAYTLSDLGS